MRFRHAEAFMYYPQRTQMPSRGRRFVDFVVEANRRGA
jgi:hypothetical protein